jgi:hypothetical protein
MSAYITAEDVRLVMGLAFFPTGLIAIIAGLIMLVAHPYRDEAKTLAAQSARLGQVDPKGVGDSIAGAAQSATALIDAVNNLIRTSSGNAIVIIVVGAAFEFAAYWLLIAHV